MGPDAQLGRRATQVGGNVRTVTIPDVLVDELRDHLGSYVGPSGDAPLFTGPKGATPKRGNWRVSVRWAERVQAAGLPAGFRFHDLRHTANDLDGEERSIHT
jgi:integrase